MEFTQCLATARSAHETLRRRSPGKSADHESLCCLNQIRQCFDPMWELTRKNPQGHHMRQAIRRLTADAELYAGVGEAEGFTDANRVWDEYIFLEQVVASASELARDEKKGGPPN